MIANTRIPGAGQPGAGQTGAGQTGAGQTGADQTAFLRERRRLVIRSPRETGLDEVTAHPDPRNRAGWRLVLRFLPSLPPRPGCEAKRAIPAGIGPANIVILDTNGEPVPNLEIQSVRDPDSGTTLIVALLASGPTIGRLHNESEPYTLELVDVEHLDPFFKRASFRFVPGQVTPLTLPLEPEPGALPEPADLNYLARDYESFRSLMLTHMARAVPDWIERNPADLGITIIEVLAFAADYLSYQQDAAGTEAYLQTARRRVSVRRHARLLDYTLHEGWNARLWIFVEVAMDSRAAGEWLPQGSQVLTQVQSAAPATLPYPSAEYEAALAAGAVVFETLYGVTVYRQHNQIAIYPWGTWDYGLAKGATTATLICGRSPKPGCEEPPRQAWPAFNAGDVVLFEQTRNPRTGEPTDDLKRRHVVRLKSVSTTHDPLEPDLELIEITWFKQDALPFDLPIVDHDCLDPDTGKPWPLAVARGNLVLADHGQTVEEELPEVPSAGKYEVDLERKNLVFHQPYYESAERQRPALDSQVQNLHKTVPAVALFALDGLQWRCQGDLVQPLAGEPWQVRQDLLESHRFDRHFVVEMESDRTARLRFGNGIEGMRPAASTRFWAYYRVGSDASADVGPDAAAHLVTSNPSLLSVRSPLPAAAGGTPQPLSQARFEAPAAYQDQLRCVTEADFIARAKRDPEVHDAACRLKPHGSWLQAILRVQRRDAKPVDSAFRARVHAFLEPFLLVGSNLEVRPPLWVSLAVSLRVRVEPTALTINVRRRLTDALSNRRLPDGQTGFFYPDAHGFAESIELAALLQRANQVVGVAEVRAEEFRRLIGSPGDELQRGLVPIGRREIARLDNDPQKPWLGTLQLKLEGGQ